MVGEEASSVCQEAGLALWAPGQGDGLAFRAPGQEDNQLDGEVAWVLGQQGTGKTIFFNLMIGSKVKAI